MTPTIYIVLYIGLWILSMIVFKCYKSSINCNLGQWLMLLWASSACVSIWMLQNRYYYLSNLYRFDIVSFFPLFYLWICILLYAMPLFVFKINKDANVSFCSKSDADIKILLLKIVAYFFIGIALVELYAYTTIPNKGSFYEMTAGTMDKKEVMEDLMGELFKSKIFIYCHKLFMIFSDSMICLSFVLFIKERKKHALVLFLAATVPVVFGSILIGNRQKLICLIMTLFVTFQIFRPFLTKDFIKKCRRVFFVSIIGISIPVVLISILRFGDYIDYLVYEILRYFGECCLNFASWLFPHLEGHDNGRRILSTLFKELPFYNPPVVTIGPFFYTFVGGIIQAVGRLWTFLIGLLFCIAAISIKQNPHKLTFGKAVLIQTIAIMCFEGLFFFIHMLNIGAFFIGFLWIIFLDTNALFFIPCSIDKILFLRRLKK